MRGVHCWRHLAVREAVGKQDGWHLPIQPSSDLIVRDLVCCWGCFKSSPETPLKHVVCQQCCLVQVSKLAAPNAPLGYFLCFLNLTFDGYTNATQVSVRPFLVCPAFVLLLQPE